MGFALPALAILGTGISAASSVMGGFATSESDQYRAAIAENNAVLAKQDATWAIQSGETQAVNKGMEVRAKVGAEKASQGGSGIDVNSGSAAAVRTGTQSLGMLDAMTIRSNAARQAYGYDVAAASDTAEAQLDRSAATGAIVGGVLGGTGSLISGASTIGSRFPGMFATAGDPTQLAGATVATGIGGVAQAAPPPDAYSGVY